ncbi:MAG: insulinase family protein [Candidatus Yanofskybacteria bacterium]|nr:insulinase family protein [Candidatus Yanofskybacteria bacterium]
MVNHFDFHTFGNGLRLIIVPMEHTKTITVLVMVGTGSRYESKEINGISHFLEHMMFKGTDKRPNALDISLELDAIGAEYNAFTSKEYTGYYAKAAMEHFDFVLEIISDIFLNSKLDPTEVEKERGVVIQEINMNFDNPMRHIMDVHEGLLYGDQPLGWTIAGPKENILKMPVEKFREYFDSHYFAQNTVVAIAGNVSSEKAKQEVVKYFDNMRQRETLKPVRVIIDQKEPALKIFNKQTDQTHVFLGVRGYDVFDPRRETLKIMSVILGGGMSSRLFTEVREKRGLAYYVGADADFYMDTGDFSSFAGLEGEKLKPAIEVILGEFRKLKEEKVSEKELKKAKDSIKGRMAISFESSDDLASFYASQELLQKEMLTPEEKFEKLNKVSVDDIFEVANDIFRTDKLNLAVIGPFKEKDPEIYNLLKL